MIILDEVHKSLLERERIPDVDTLMQYCRDIIDGKKKGKRLGCWYLLLSCFFLQLLIYLLPPTIDLVILGLVRLEKILNFVS